MRITNVETHKTLFIFCTNGVEKQFVRGGKVPLGQHQRDVVHVRKMKIKKVRRWKNGLNGKHDEINQKHHFQGIWDDAIKIKCVTMDIWHSSNKRVSSFTFTGCETSTTANPCASIILCGASDLVAKCPHHLLHPGCISQVVSLVKGQQHGWILWCAAFLCALRRGGRRVQRGHDREKPQQVRRDRWYLPKATKSQAHWSSWLLSKDKKALHLNYHFSYNYFKAQLCLYWYCY